ncbi:Pre-rRNA-processing protein [Plasmodiophora brassicae]
MSPCSCQELESFDWNQHPQRAFEVGVRCALDDWCVLQTAIADGWAGSDAVGNLNQNELFVQLVKMFGKGNPVDPFDIADFLDLFMANKFNCELEDDSPEWVADLVVRLHADCTVVPPDFSGLKTLIHRNRSPPTLLAIAKGETIPAVPYSCQCSGKTALPKPKSTYISDEERAVDGADDDDDDDDEVVPEVVPLIDPDGWQTVQSKSKRNQHRRR